MVTMKAFLFGICLCVSITTKAQPEMVVENALVQIKTIPSHYTQGQ